MLSQTRRSIQEHLLHINMQRFRGGLVLKAHRLSHHSALGLKVVKKKKKVRIIRGVEEYHALPIAEVFSERVQVGKL